MQKNNLVNKILLASKGRLDQLKCKLLYKETKLVYNNNIENFIPYYCHYDSATVLTKNGELIQTIRINSFASDVDTKNQETSVRHVIRDAIKEHVDSASISIWFHTIRHPIDMNILYDSYDHFVTQELHNKWIEKQNWKNKHINDIYISFVYKNKKIRLFSRNTFLALIRMQLTLEHNLYLERAHTTLDNVVGEVNDKLQDYGSHRLSVIRLEGKYYSQIISFFQKLIKIEDYNYQVPISNISSYMTDSMIAFGNKIFECMDKQSKVKKFGTIISFKEYNEVSTPIIDKVLQLDQSFIITQTLNFVNRDEAFNSFVEQKYVTDLSESEIIRELSGIDDIINSDNDKEVDYGEHQLTIMPIANSIKQLNEDLESLYAVISKIGLVGVRQDLLMEDLFWSQLPGNFAFISRQTYISTSKVAGFASTDSLPVGKRNHNHWGHYITVFNTRDKAAYFFNFHYKDQGHTILLGDNLQNTIELLNFMIVESTKFNCKIFYLDYGHASYVLTRALQGNYYDFNYDNQNFLIMSPLRLGKKSSKFICKWLESLVISSGFSLDKGERQLINDVVAELVNSDEAGFSQLIDILTSKDGDSIVQKLASWYGEGEFTSMFDNQDDDYLAGKFHPNINVFDINFLLKNKQFIIPVLLYWIHITNLSLNGEPFIIVINEAWDLLRADYFIKAIPEWLEFLRQNNAIVIFVDSNILHAKGSKLIHTVKEYIATHVFLPNEKKIVRHHKQIFQFDDKDAQLFQTLSYKNKEFMIKHANHSVVASLKLDQIKEKDVLYSNTKKIVIADDLIKEIGTNPKSWLAQFYSEVEND